MSHAGRIVALGLTLIVGGLAGFLIGRGATATPATVSTQPAAAVAPTVTETVQAEPVTVTATVAPEPNDDPNGPKDNGSYLVGPQLAAGTWQCSEGQQSTRWATKGHAGDVIDIDFTTIASVRQTAYSADLTDCLGTWSLVG